MDMNPQIRIIRMLAEILSQPPKSVEVLPGDIVDWTCARDVTETSTLDPHSEIPFFYRDGNVGIPQKVLYRLYMAAITLFATSQTTEDIYQASCILLLANPAHRSALNARKHLVQGSLLPPKQELAFTETLLRASNDCAKQGILWDHRRWLLKLLHPLVLPPIVKPFCDSRRWCSAQGLQEFPYIPLDDINREFHIIRDACAMYPRNYYAWSHWHFIVDVIYVVLSIHRDHDQYLDALAGEFFTLYRWVDQHVSDHTAIHHLCNLGQVFFDLNECYSSPLINLFSGVSSPILFLAEQAMALATSYPGHESLWMYLRRVIAALGPRERKGVIDFLELSPVFHDPMAKRLFAWIELQGF
ncbi:hypothetical protein BDZ94DRAFT_1243714 [Collybia nuda]|uniref:Protein prenylyltransferase n=1 Tax=Collybia nuda TaxID=64659 RepID=A0A9P6CKW3_9AGAR|nr:hypothetical protein BDZ94DRAFT_1243714 [Collybia nuda]